jgi:hypothetical protein
MSKHILIAILLIGLPVTGHTQTDTGIPSHQLIVPINAFESLNLGNINILLQAPVRAKGGPFPLNFMLTANVQLYELAGQYASTISQGTSLARGYWGGELAGSWGTYNCGHGVGAKVTITGLIDGNGTLHPVPTSYWYASGNSSGCASNVDVFTQDNSGYELVIANGTGTPVVYDNRGFYADFSGTSSYWAPSSIADPHGNVETVTNTGTPQTITYTDPLTSTAALSYIFPAQQPPGTSIAYQYTDGTGTLQSVTSAFTGGTSGVTFLPAFSCPGFSASSTIYPLASVTFPDTTALALTWEKTSAGNYDGRLATVKVPTGATYTHSYSGGTHGDGLWCGSSGISNATLSWIQPSS